MDITIDKLEAALRKLGKSSYGVAMFLRERGIKGGIRGEPCDCPVMEYLHRELGRDVPLVVGQQMAAILDPGDGVPLYYLRVDLPNGVRDFVADFDRGMYPELVVPR